MEEKGQHAAVPTPDESANGSAEALPVFTPAVSATAMERLQWAAVVKAAPPGSMTVRHDDGRLMVRVRRGRYEAVFIEPDEAAQAAVTAAILELDNLYSGAPLVPHGSADRKRALAVNAWYAGTVADAVTTLTAASTRQRFPALKVISSATAMAQRACDYIITAAGESGYLTGDAFGLADMTAAAILAPLIAPRLAGQAAAGRNLWPRHPAAEWVKGIYRRHRGGSAARPDFWIV